MNLSGSSQNSLPNLPNPPNQHVNSPALIDAAPSYSSSEFPVSNGTFVGTGSTSTCYKYRHNLLGNIVFKKVHRVHSGTAPQEVIQRREYDILLQTNHHQYIVSFFGYVFEDSPDRPIGFLLEYMAGFEGHRDVQKYIKSASDVDRAKRINTFAVQIATALGFIHSRNVMHRDLKPDNILISRDGMVAKLSDFGLARDIEKEPSKEFTRNLGYWRYAAPEILSDNLKRGFDGRFLRNNQQYTYSVDIYSYGMVLYYMYYREEPFDENLKKENFKTKVKTIQGTPGVEPVRPQLTGKPIDEIIRGCWPSDPDLRLSTLEILMRFNIQPEIFPIFDA